MRVPCQRAMLARMMLWVIALVSMVALLACQSSGPVVTPVPTPTHRYSPSEAIAVVKNHLLSQTVSEKYRGVGGKDCLAVYSTGEFKAQKVVQPGVWYVYHSRNEQSYGLWRVYERSGSVELSSAETRTLYGCK
jgi:hypothetical protein